MLDILKSLFSEVKAAARIPEENRKEMREALADTAELIDETLAIGKQHLSSILSELKYGDKQKAKQMIYELADFQGWEEKYRQFQLCDKLREATFNLERKGIYKLKNAVSFNDPGKIQQKMWDYIGGETSAGNSVGAMLQDLSQLEKFVDAEEQRVVGDLDKSRTEIAKWRQLFIDFEKEIRLSMT